MFKNIYLSKIVHSHKKSVFITIDSNAIYWQDSNSFLSWMTFPYMFDPEPLA